MSIKRQFLWSMAPLLVISVVNIVSVPLFFRYLGDERYALWGYIGTFTGMFGFADLGLGVAVGRYIGVALGKGDHTAVREYWATGNLIALPLLALMALAFSGLGMVFGPLWFQVAPANEHLLRACFAAGGAGLFVNYYGQFWTILSQAHLDFKFIGILRMGTTLLQVIPAIVLAWAGLSILQIILWSVLAGGLQLGVFVWHARRRYQLGFNLRAAKSARAREMAAYTGKTFASLVAGSLFGSIDQFVLGRLAPPADFANYRNGAANLGARLQGLGAAVMGPVFHNTSRTVAGDRSVSAASIYNETFHFVFGWYLLAAVWAATWHPVLLRLWLGEARGLQVAPLFTPIIIAYCITAMANISGAQLGALNRVGAALGFTIAAGLLTVAGVWIGWRMAGVVGVAYGFLFSRIAFVAQDLYTIRLVGAVHWFSASAWWRGVAVQCLVGGGFALAYCVMPRRSPWLLLPAALHGSLVATWLLRHDLRKFAVGFGDFRAARPIPASSQPPEV